MTSVQPNRRFTYRFIKRTADIVFSLFGLIALSPLFVLIAVAVASEREGGVIFHQARAGWKNQPFMMYKFRTMVKNAAALRDEMEQFNELDGPAFKMKTNAKYFTTQRFNELEAELGVTARQVYDQYVTTYKDLIEEGIANGTLVDKYDNDGNPEYLVPTLERVAERLGITV